MTEDYYYNTDWKCVEERDSGEPCPRKQYVYGIRGRNDLVCGDRYLYNSSSGSPSCSSAGKERHYALADAMGSTTAITNTSGTVAERYSYTAFGQSQVMDASFTNRSLNLYDWQTRFHGESRDDETGYYNYGYRYYLPELGKWPSRDPIGENGGVNLYGFVGNDAVNYFDYLGMKGICDCLNIDVSVKTVELEWSWNPLNGFGVYRDKYTPAKDDSEHKVNRKIGGESLVVRVHWKKPESKKCCKLRKSQKDGTDIFLQYWRDDKIQNPKLGRERLPMAGILPNHAMDMSRGMVDGKRGVLASNEHKLPNHQAGELRVQVKAGKNICFDGKYTLK
jgi:RHS repeat-associated protein